MLFINFLLNAAQTVGLVIGIFFLLVLVIIVVRSFIIVPSCPLNHR